MKKIYTMFVALVVLAAANVFGQYCIPPPFSSGPYTGILNVTFESINNTTAGTIGYADYTASAGIASVEQGATVPISIQCEHTICNSGFTDNVDLRVWIDWNQDDDFADAGEEMINTLVDLTIASGSYNTVVYAGNITVPGGAALGTTRMRVYEDMLVADGHSAPTPCGYTSGIGQHGEAEDYTIEVTAPGAGAAPVTDFIADQTTVFEATVVNFTDLSTNTPTSWTWTIIPGAGWSFSGGSTSASQNPSVLFSTAGLYTVELLASNATGSDIETKTDYITVNVDGSGIEENHSISEVSIYPNPATDNCNLNFSLVQSENASIKVYNMLGELVIELNDNFSAGPNKVILNTASLNQGIYFIDISTSLGRISKELAIL